MVVDPEKIVAHLIHDTIGTSRYEFPVSEIVGGFGRRWHDPKATQLMNQTWLCMHTGKIKPVPGTNLHILLKYDCTGTVYSSTRAVGSLHRVSTLASTRSSRI